MPEQVRSYSLSKDYTPATLNEMIANKQNNSYQNDLSFVTPTPSDAEIAEKKLEEEAYAFDVCGGSKWL